MAPFDKALAASPEEGMTAKLVEGAKKEGELLFYFSMTVPEGAALLNKFHDKYPFIKVEMFRNSSEKLTSRVLAEAQAKKHRFDVIAIPSSTIEFLKRKNIFAKYLSPQGKYFPEIFKDPDGYGIAAFYLLNVVAYNTKAVAQRDIPKTYDDLLDAKWKGKIAMDTGGFDWFGNVLKIMGEAKGLQYMKKLGEQDIQFRAGKTLVCQLVAAGERIIGLPVFSQRIDMMRSQGAPIEYVFIEPLISELNSPSVSANAPHPNAARLFVDFLLSREGQDTIASFYRLPTREDVEARVPRSKAKGLKILPFDPGIIDNYEKYAKLYRDILIRK